MPLFAGERQLQIARATRRSQPIHVYVGRNGSGKTLTAVFDTMPTLDGTGLADAQPRPVLSTARLLDWVDRRPCEGWESAVVSTTRGVDGIVRPQLDQVPCADEWHGIEGHMQAHPLYVPWRGWQQFLDWSFGDILADEVVGVADSGDSDALPAPVKIKLPQLRRGEIAFRITGLGWMRIAKRIRESVQAVTRCQSTMPVPRKAEFGSGRIYRPRRLVQQATYDAQSLPTDDHTLHAYESADRLARGRLWVPDSPARYAYDTFAPVNVVGSVSDTGRCVRCDGVRRVQECNCHDYTTAKDARKAVAGPRDGSLRPSGVARPVAGRAVVPGRHHSGAVH